jgi:tetratricopeptide (TPR) repeat protein
MDIILILTILGIAATLIAPAAGYLLKLRKEFKQYYSVIWKSSGKLKPKDLLGERPYGEYYFPRNVDSLLSRSLERRRNTLVIGPPLSGKTRAVFNSIKNQKRKVDVLVPRNVSMATVHFPFNFKFWKDKLIFIDDLQYYIERQDNYHVLFRKAKEAGIVIVATCHSGIGFKKVKNKLIEQNIDLDTIFGEDIIELDKISTDEGKKVAETMGLKWDNVKFNGTIGSIFMKLSEMERRYDRCDNIEKTILRSLRSLYICGIYDDNNTFRIDWLKKYAGKYELDGKDFEWTGWLKSLEEKEFIKIQRRGRLWAEDAYLEYIVRHETENTQIDIFEDTIEIFSDSPEVLHMAGERAYDIGNVDVNIADYMRLTISAFEKIVSAIDKNEREAEYLKAQNYLGQAYWSLSKVQDTLENCAKSIEYYNEVLKAYTISTHPQEYARIKNRMGNTYLAFADVTNNAENCRIAIESYNEALKVITIKNEPHEYGRTYNNLGGAYLQISETENRVPNMKKAIECFKEALKVRTLQDYPKDYAITKNNIASAHAQLSQYEQTEYHLKLALNSFDDTLSIYTKEKFPLQYGQTMNNIGNAYSMLGDIVDKKKNLTKAIESYEKSLEVRTLANTPLLYANTMMNLGDAYFSLSAIENERENLINALEAFEEAIKIRTVEKYPQQYASAMFHLGKIYIKLAEFEDKTENYHKGTKAFDEALIVFTEESSPELYHKIQSEITQAKKIFF